MTKVLLLFSLGVNALGVNLICKRTATATAVEADLDISPGESVLLTLASLHLKDERGVQDWERALTDFLASHRKDPEVRKAIEAFVLDYTNNPPRGYLPGDWPVKRPIREWWQFYLQHPHYYVRPTTSPGTFHLEALGNETPLKESMAVFSGQSRDPLSQRDKEDRGNGLIYTGHETLQAAGLFGVVIRTLQQAYQYGKEVRGTSTPEKRAELRKTFLQMKLLEEGLQLYREDFRLN